MADRGLIFAGVVRAFRTRNKVDLRNPFRRGFTDRLTLGRFTLGNNMRPRFIRTAFPATKCIDKSMYCTLACHSANFAFYTRHDV